MPEGAARGSSRERGLREVFEALQHRDRVEMEDLLPIRRMLVSELRRRGLLSAPPAFLGYADLERWDERSLDLLACEAFEAAVLQRWDALVAKAAVFEAVDGLVLRNVRSFLTHRQASADPVGASVYRQLRAGAGAGLEGGWLSSPEDRRPPAGDQLLTAPGRVAAAATEDELRRRLSPGAEWWDHLRAVAEGGRGGPAAGAAVLQTLLASGVEAFTLARTARVLTPPCRALLASQGDGEGFGAEEDGEAGGLVPVVRPEGLDSYREWRELVRAVEGALARLDTPAPRREALSQLFQRLVSLAEEERLEELSQGRLAEALGLARSTMSDYMRALREVVARVLRTMGDPDG